jgi:hypothetical protein
MNVVLIFRVYLESISGSRILKTILYKLGSEWILRRLDWGVKWIQVALVRDRWRGTMNTAMGLLVLAPWS